MQENGVNSGVLKPKQRAALAALLTEKTRQAAAQKARVSESQLYKWLKDPIFKTALTEAEAAARNEIKRRVIRRAATIADTIGDIMDDPETSPAVRLQAATKLADIFYKTDDQAELDARITALEARQYED